MTIKRIIVGTIVCCYCLTVATANPAVTSRDSDSELERFEAKLVSALDDLDKNDSIGIYDGIITLEKTNAGESRSVYSDDYVEPLMSRIDEFLGSRKLQIKFPSDGSSADYLGRALGEKNIGFELRGLVQGASEGRSKLVKRILLPILLALKLKAIVVLPIVITLIGLVGIKGLGAGVMALLLSGAVALKALLTPPSYHATRLSYAKPIEIHPWHRSQVINQEELINQPYRAYAPDFSPTYDPQFGPYQEIP